MNDFKNNKKATAKEQEDANLLLTRMIELVSNFWKFVYQMKEANSDNKSATFTQQMYNEKLKRLSVIESGLKDLQDNYASIESNYEIWYGADSGFDI